EVAAAARRARRPYRRGDGALRPGARTVRPRRRGRARAAPGPPRELVAATVQRRRRGRRQPRGAPAHASFRAPAAATAGAPGPHPRARRPPLHQRLRTDLGRTRSTMNRKGDKALIVGLDIGTSKVVALVGEYDPANSGPGNPIEVIGIGSHESRGLKRGVVVDIESTVQSIQRAVEEAELMAGCEISSVYASISGNHVQCRNSPGIVPIRDGEVTWADLDRVLEAAKAVAIPADQRILHAIPREYVLDDSQEGIRNPVGMTGVRLEV